MNIPGRGLVWRSPPASHKRARELIRRRRERMTLESLQGLVVHLGGLREERKAVLAVSEGWIHESGTRIPGDAGNVLEF